MKEMTERQKQRLVYRVLKYFDFKKVHKVMTSLNWKWRGEVPTIDEIRSEAERLLYSVVNNENCLSMETGGFVAERKGDSLILSFRLEISEIII